MTNEELKKKIVEVIREFRDSKPIVPNDYGLQIISGSTDRELADALIAAGLTFEPMTFRIVENKPYSYTAGELANWKEDQDRIAKLLHRAEVAERALLTACIKMVKDEKSDVNIELLVGVIYRKYLKQAEKELEGKE